MTSPTPLKRYERSSQCLKCGATGASVEFYAAEKTQTTFKPERIRRICRECKFIWFELPLDSPSAEPERLTGANLASTVGGEEIK